MGPEAIWKEYFDSYSNVYISDFGLLAVHFLKMSPVEVP
jgi:hypothetical protein